MSIGSEEVHEVTPLYEDELFSAVNVSVHGMTGESINTGSDSMYMVTEGTAMYLVDGVKHSIKAGESVFVPRGSLYSGLGNHALLFVVSSPPFDESKVIRLPRRRDI